MKTLLMRLLPRTVTCRVLYLMSLIMILLVLVPAWLFYRSFLASVVQAETNRGQAAYRQVLGAIEERSIAMGMLTYTIAQIPEFQKYFAEGDRESLERATVPLYKELEKNYNVNILQFHTPPATSFFRAHQPKKFGDDLSSFRKTVLEANARKEKVLGLEDGVGGLSARAVLPIAWQGKHLGTVELGLAVNDKMLKQIREQAGVHISLVGPDGEGFKYLAKTHDMSIPPQQFPFLRQMMQLEKVVSKQVEKDGKLLITTYGPIKDFSGKISGVLAVPIDITAEIKGAKRTMTVIIGIGLGILAFFIGLMCLLFNRMVNKPVEALKKAMEEASRGNLTQQLDSSNIPGVNCAEIMHCNNPSCSMYGKTGYCWAEAGSVAENIQCPKILGKVYHSCSECKACFGKAVPDEFSELTMYFNALIGNMKKMVGAIQGNSVSLHEASGSLGGVSQHLASGVEQAAGRASTVAAASEEMSGNMNAVAAAVEEAAANLQMMSNATEGMSATIGEIQQAANTARGITSQAVGSAQEISSQVDQLGSAAQEIGQVTETITEISSQTNLLALNATIEAARAGEAGKGFAVVANEIKELARQTAAATGEIKQRIEGIQSASGATVGGIRKISEVISRIDEIVSTIAHAIDEQTNTMHELTSNIQQAGEGVGEVARNVGQTSAVSVEIAKDVAGLREATADISRGSDTVKDKAALLRQLAEELKTMVSRFQLE